MPGHEFAGEVVAVGAAGAPSCAIGDRVAVDPSLYCHECHYCRIGRNNLCERWAAIGVTVPGGAAEYAAAPGRQLRQAARARRAPEDAALIEPLSCAVRGYDILRAQLAAHVLIYGSGTMGLMMLELAKRTGAATVDMVDINEERLATARTLGCSATATSADAIERPRGWDVVIDATGNAAGHPGRRSAGSARAAPSSSSASPTTRRGPPSSRTGSTTRRSPSPARWPCCTATSGPPSCSRAACSTRRCSSATGCRWCDYAAALQRFQAGQGRKIQVVP